MVFLEASDEVLIRRFEATRRRHLVAGERVAESIALTRPAARAAGRRRPGGRHQRPQRARAGGQDPGRLRRRGGRPAGDGDLLGFKYGLPWTPTWWSTSASAQPALCRSCARSPAPTRRCATTCSPQDGTGLFLARLEALLETALPGYVQEGKQYLTVAIGCTGGKHRSVVLATELAGWLTDKGYRAHVAHRDVERE